MQNIRKKKVNVKINEINEKSMKLLKKEKKTIVLDRFISVDKVLLHFSCWANEIIPIKT